MPCANEQKSRNVSRFVSDSSSYFRRLGTNERICMVKGKIPHVMKVMEAVMEKIREKVDPNCPPDQFDHKGIQRTKEVCST